MNLYDFEQFLDRQPKLKGTETLGRFVKNAFGIDERVVLPKSYWQYVDWLVAEQNINVEAYIIDCDKERGELTLSENLMEWLYFDMTERQANNHPYPDFLETV